MIGLDSPPPPPSRGWRALIVIAILAGVASLGWLALRDFRSLVGQSADLDRLLKRPIAVRVEAARSEDLNELIGANGLVEAVSFVKVPARVTGVVEKVRADVGDLVKAGDVLVEMEPLIPMAALLSAKAEVAKSKAQVEVARAQYDRMESLFLDKIISQAEFDRARLELEAARASESSSNQGLRRAELDASVGTQIVAPITGIIQERYINPGESIREDRQDFFRVGRIDEVAVVAKVAEEKTPSVQLGYTAEVIFDAFPNEVWTGEIYKMDPNIDPQTRTFNAFVKVKNPELRVKPGLSAYVRIKRQGHALTIPRLSVMNNAGQASVFVVEGDRARLRPVKVQPATFGRLGVVEGLKEGDKVVYYKLLKLEDNDLVTIDTTAAQETPKK